MLINKNGLTLFKKVLEREPNRLENTQCAGIKIVYLVFTVLAVRLFTQKTNCISNAMLFLDNYI